MTVIVAIIAHKADGVLPITGFLITRIAYNLVNQHLCLGLRTCRQTSHCQIALVSTRQISTLALIEHAEEVVGNVAICLTE